MTTMYVAVDGPSGPLPAGTLYTHQRGNTESATFTYDANYLANPRAYALDPALPLATGPFQTSPGRALFGTFNDSTPDRWGRRLVTRAHRASASAAMAPRLTEADFLLGLRDDLRTGALRLRTDPSGLWLAPTGVEIPRLTNLSYLLDLATRSIAGDVSNDEIQLLVDSGSGLGGARPKVHVDLGDGNFAIAKFPSENTDTWNVSAWEAVALDVTSTAGIPCAQYQLISVADRAVLLSTRFDRDRNGDRIGFWSAMTALEAQDGDTGSYLELADFTGSHSPDPRLDLELLWRRAVVDVLIHNTDNHLRNHGFLRVSGGWTYSPVFDINPNPDASEFATGLETPDGSDLTVDTLIDAADFFGLTLERAREQLAVAVGACARWREFAGKRGLRSSEVAAMAPAFEHAELARAAEILG